MEVYETEMIKTGIEAIGDFCYTFGSNLTPEVSLQAVDMIEKKCDLNKNLYSQMDIEGIKDYSIYTLG